MSDSLPIYLSDYQYDSEIYLTAYYIFAHLHNYWLSTYITIYVANYLHI